MRKNIAVRNLGLVVVALVIAQLAGIQPAWTQEYTDVYVLGRPATTFSVHSPKDLGDLQDLFDRYEADLRKILELGNWNGDPDDLFTAVRAAKDGDGTVTRRSVSHGESLQWMAYRRNGEPAVITNPRWMAKKPYDAWQIKVDSNGQSHTFVVPVSCMNLALDRSEAMPSMTCNVSASFDAASDLVTVTGRTDGKKMEISSFQVPGGEGNMNDLKSAGDMKWTYQPMADGLHRFNATAGSGKGAKTCSGEVNVVREKAACRIDVTVDPETYVMSIDATNKTGDFEFAGMTLPDGSTAQIDAFENVGDHLWTYDAAESLPKKPGDYTYTFNGKSVHRGSDAMCDKVVVITRSAPDYRWTVRGYGMLVKPTGSRSERDELIAVPLGLNGSVAEVPQQQEFWADDGTGFGFDIEYMLTPNFGIEGGFDIGDVDGHFMVDRPEVWLMDVQGIDFWDVTIGANYHFTPQSRVDFYAGALLGYFSYDGARYDFSEIDETFDLDFGSDVGFGLKAGLDIPFKAGGPWVFSAGLRYIVTGGDADQGDLDLDVDPWIGSIGIGYRF